VTQTAEAPARPTPPAKAIKLIPGLLIGLGLLILGGFTALTAAGVIWGLIGAAGVVLSFRFTRQPLTTAQAVVMGAAVLASSVATTMIVSEVPERIGVVLTLSVAGSWAISGAAAAWVLSARGVRLTTAINAALGWVGAGAIALAASNTFGFLTPISEISGDDEAILRASLFAFIGFTVGMIGLAPTLGAASRLPMLTAGALVLFVTLFAAAEVGFSVFAFLRDIRNMANVPNFWPPDFGWAIGEGNWWWPPSWEFGAPTRANPLLETFRISIIASIIGCGVALPVAFMASTVTAPTHTVYLVDKGIMSLIRTVPDLFWALIFVAALSVGPLPGALALIFFSLGIMGKLLSETVDAVDPGPLEAARATGASHFVAVRASVLPQVLPNYVAYALYIFEINIRASVVIGLAGAGGIGRVLEAQRTFFRFDRVLAIVILIFVLVFVIEQVSVALRRRLV
jgi:phosphonate transport system permease protein